MTDFFTHLTLTSDQQAAVDKLDVFLKGPERAFVLQGYAGSGKTTLLRGVVDYLEAIQRRYQLMAPTGRAAKVIADKTGCKATTVHKGIYNYERLEETGEEADSNGQSFLYHFKLRVNPNVHDSILIIDEASMLSDAPNHGEFFRFGSGRLLSDLLDYGKINDGSVSSKIIFVGDPAQLPPIGMNFSPALTPDYLHSTHGLDPVVVEMKEVKRQGGESGILLAATRIRQCLTSGYFNDFDLSEDGRTIVNPSFNNFLDTYKQRSGDKILICYKNKTALDLNTRIRIDKFGEDLPIQPSDRVIIGANNYRLGILNGEFAVVAEADQSTVRRVIPLKYKENSIDITLNWRKVSLLARGDEGQAKTVSGYLLENYLYGSNTLSSEEQRALYVDFKTRHPKLKKGTEEFKEAILNDPYLNCLQLKYGYAVTCHKAQGGEWDGAFVFWDKGVKDGFNYYESNHDPSGKQNSEFYRWAYTAVTRASEKLYCINPPTFSSFSNMVYVGEEVQRAYDELTSTTRESVTIEASEVAPALDQFGLAEAPLSLQEHFVYRWYHLRKKYIEIVNWERKGYEIRYTFKREDERAAAKYWVNKNNKFKPKCMKIPNQTTSDGLFDTVVNILNGAAPVLLKKDTIESVLAQLEFDAAIEESKPFLKSLYDAISSNLDKGTVVTEVDHLNYRERYTIANHTGSCVVDFEYTGTGFFGRVVPLMKQCNSSDILFQVHRAVGRMKEAGQV